MKKLILSLCALVCFITDSSAFRIGGVEFSWKRGKPEWNATKTDVFCVGRGMCTGTIKFDISTTATNKTPDGSELFDIEHNQFSANLVNYEGKLAIEVSRRFYNSFQSDFTGNFFEINGDINIDIDTMKRIGFTSSRIIRSGKYQFKIDPTSGAFLILIS